MNSNKIDELNMELQAIKKKNSHAYQHNVLPGIQKKTKEFLAAFEDYFRERGFVVKKEQHSVKVAFDSLEFTAFTKDEHDIFILKEREPIASISVKHKTPTKSAAYTFDHPQDQLNWEIKKEKTLANYLEHPEFYYTGSEFGKQYEHPLTVLDSIFHV